MDSNNGFSVSRKGYNCSEVDQYVDIMRETEAQLRESYSELLAKYDSLYDGNSKLREENARLRNDCATLAAALKKLKEETEAQEDYKAKYEEMLNSAAEPETEDETQPEAEPVEEAQPEEQQAEEPISEKEPVAAPVNYSESASKMISEVAQVVQKLEQDARRKADAITVAAKLEKEKSKLIKERVDHEVRSLMDMLSGFLEETGEEIAEETEE